MLRPRLQVLSVLLTVALVWPFPASAFDTPLSDTAIREAYFLGQRHDESMARFLDKYVKHLAMPKSGPYVSSVSLYTPYAMVVLDSSRHAFGYSAQQAEIDHRDRKETIRAIIEIQLTESYPGLVPDPASNSPNSGNSLVLRSPDFWNDFQIQFLDGEKVIRPLTSSGHPNYMCSDEGGCILTGATLQFEFLADTFPPDQATVQIDPPEGEQILVDFDLSSLR